jgi:myb proto-oncogene protein
MWDHIKLRSLLQVKRKYRIAPTSAFAERRVSPLFFEGRQRISPKIERDDFNILTMSQIDLDLGKMRTMTAEQAAEVAARAVAEAEAAIAVAEEAAREAETAEADAEAAQAFAEAAMKTLKGRTAPKMVNFITGSSLNDRF